LRTGFVHDKVPAPEILTVEGSDCAIRLFIIGDFDEGESARLARETITNKADCGGIDTDLTEPFLQLLFRCVERKIADVKLLHLGTPSARNLTHDCGAHQMGHRQKGKPKECLRAGSSSVVAEMVSKNNCFCNKKALAEEAGIGPISRGPDSRRFLLVKGL
jgi:hypothetical protein